VALSPAVAEPHALRICHEHDCPLEPDSLICPAGHECDTWDTYDRHGNLVAVASERELLRVSETFWYGLEAMAKKRYPLDTAKPMRRE
jgi:hypothetical protein